MKSILLLFELSSGLKINFAKSSLLGLNTAGDHLLRIYGYLRCKLSSDSLSDLGILVGSRSSIGNQPVWVRDLDLFGSIDLGSWLWFRDGLVRHLGDESNTRFWLDKWLGSDMFSDKYRRLYNFSTTKEGLVFNFGIWVGDLNQLKFHINKPDSWDWIHDKSKFYSVKSAYRIITHPDQLQNLTDHHHCSIWKSKAPLKVLSFAWRLFQDRIPTMDALVKRGVPLINDSASLCVFCKSHQEFVTHLFSSCDFSYALWQLMYNWLNVSLAIPLTPIHHFTSFLGLIKNRKSWKLWSIIWFAIIWAL
ncbi:hypothetical protein Lal_00039105 [Lupinus albus]|nr:hypothetical protein Lal_00039105 [Lupinus albus]